jgi:lysylphosphatidylglycerol synthetase-like protein (DUF2156 family)
MFEMWQFLIAMVLVFLGVPTAGFAVLALFEGFPKIRLGQIAGIVAVLAWVFALFSAGPWNEGWVIFLGAVALILIFLTTWKREFRLLMLRRDEEFPGKWDRLAWFLVMSLAPAFGPWLFRSYRKARWPEFSVSGRWTEGPSVAPRKPKSSPWDDEEEADAPSPAPAGVE